MNIITILGVLLLVVVAIFAFIQIKSMWGFGREKLSAPNFNWDAGAGTRIDSQEWTQPQMIGDVGLGGSIAPEQNELYTKYKQGYVHNLYDYGNIFHIPTSTTNASDTTED